jgi:hypothetical protein
MTLPEGMTYTIGRRTYGPGDELPAAAPEPIKVLARKRLAFLEQQAKATKSSEPAPVHGYSPPPAGDKADGKQDGEKK